MEAEAVSRVGSGGGAVAVDALEGFLRSVLAETVAAAGEAVALLLLAMETLEHQLGCPSEPFFRKGRGRLHFWNLSVTSLAYLLFAHASRTGIGGMPFTVAGLGTVMSILPQMGTSSGEISMPSKNDDVDERCIVPVSGRSKNRAIAESKDDGETDDDDDDDDDEDEEEDGDDEDSGGEEYEEYNETDGEGDDDPEANGGGGSEEDDGGAEEEDDDGEEEDGDEEEEEEDEEEDEEDDAQPPTKKRK